MPFSKAQIQQVKHLTPRTPHVVVPPVRIYYKPGGLIPSLSTELVHSNMDNSSPIAGGVVTIASVFLQFCSCVITNTSDLFVEYLVRRGLANRQ